MRKSRAGGEEIKLSLYKDSMLRKPERTDKKKTS
jgi:hypothetical protein